MNWLECLIIIISIIFVSSVSILFIALGIISLYLDCLEYETSNNKKTDKT